VGTWEFETEPDGVGVGGGVIVADRLFEVDTVATAVNDSGGLLVADGVGTKECVLVDACVAVGGRVGDAVIGSDPDSVHVEVAIGDTDCVWAAVIEEEGDGVGGAERVSMAVVDKVYEDVVERLKLLVVEGGGVKVGGRDAVPVATAERERLVEAVDEAVFLEAVRKIDSDTVIADVPECDIVSGETDRDSDTDFVTISEHATPLNPFLHWHTQEG
jgi:hypothetical protein